MKKQTCGMTVLMSLAYISREGGEVMNRKLVVRGFAVALGVLFVYALAGSALAADTLTVARGNGIVDTFQVIPCPPAQGCGAGTYEMLHIAVGNNGAGPGYSNDFVGLEPGQLSLICGGWITSNTGGTHPELHVFAYFVPTGEVLEWAWGVEGSTNWSGPIWSKPGP
jgi:hypothetical protein